MSFKIVPAVKYKSNKDALRVHVDKINKKSIHDINSVFKKSNEHTDTVRQDYIYY